LYVPQNCETREVYKKLIGNLGQELPTGTITTIPGFEPAFKAKVVFGADWLSVDPDGKRARVDVRGIAVYVNLRAVWFKAVLGEL
jgi:hypothetical protein